MSELLRKKTLRRWVFQRDGGVCASCFCDAEFTQKILQHALMHLRYLVGRRALSQWRDLVVLAGFDSRRASWWEADHIHPLSEGGADTLKNLRTLCLPCHRRETMRLRKRLAKYVRLRRKQPQAKYQTHHLYRLGE